MDCARPMGKPAGLNPAQDGAGTLGRDLWKHWQGAQLSLAMPAPGSGIGLAQTEKPRKDIDSPHHLYH